MPHGRQQKYFIIFLKKGVKWQPPIGNLPGGKTWRCQV